MPWYNGDYPPSYKNQPEEVREKAVEIANALLTDGAEEGIAIATGLKQARELLRNHKAENDNYTSMENSNQNLENHDDENTNENANSAYSGSGSMQPGGSTGEAGLNDDPEENDEEETDQNQPEGKSIAEATDPSKLDQI